MLVGLLPGAHAGAIPVRTLVAAFHKPAGLVCTHGDELGRPTVYDHFRSRVPAWMSEQPWHAVGRLDQNTSGLLLMTNDGALVHHVSNPTASCKGIDKTYRARVMGHLDETVLCRLRSGVELSGGQGTSMSAMKV